MPKNGYLDTDAVVNAAKLINSTLESKGFIQLELLFNSIDWKKLIEDQASDSKLLTDLEVTESIYNNDKNVINIIYSLLQSVDRHQTLTRSLNKNISKKDEQISKLESQVKSLQNQLTTSESKLNKSVQVDNSQLIRKNKQLTHVNKIQAQDLSKLKNWCQDIKTKYQVEMKRKSIEISELKQKLLETRNLPTTSTFGMTPPSRSSDKIINSAVIHNNIPSIDNSTQMSDIQPVLNSEYEELAGQLADVIDSLLKENYRFSSFVKSINHYFSSVNSQLANKNPKNLLLIALPNPSDEIDFVAIASATGEEIESFDFVAKPFLNNIYKNFHYLGDLIALIDSGSNGTTSDTDLKLIEKLIRENKTLADNCQAALKTIDDWESYHREQKNGKE